ncbi:hypothetical protein NCS57_00594800 [Fusarium keratoplasticum]|uniref:Uncharacterized protein n=1 Tax=Fusarium keratoplasticum TaxID=1328300 RepID=A0ACC0R3Z3_9HYPO|nr:hypothetical protein NCS57_00594800 [Fusarium keratoplasticum]KAI8671206.1 hypothetical protein NCS57_00594800 [Fusarium keratoplasticum]KAI8678437.1 hypothetical protein NCS55_00564300 [Fusarium keratoplasticum]
MSSELLTRIELPFLVALRYKEDPGQNDSGYVRPQGSPVPYPSNNYQKSAAGFTHPQVREDCGLWATLFLEKLLAHYWKFPRAEMWTFSYEKNLQETQCDEYRWIGMKVTSPYLEPTDDQYRQLEAVLKLLNEKLITFASAETRLKLTFKPRQGAFNLERLKEIASMLWVTDPLLSRLHPPHCGPSSLPSLGFQFTNLVREHHPIDLKVEMGLGVLIDDPWTDRLSWHRRQLRVMAHPGELCEGRYRPGLDKIHKAKSIPDLLHLLKLAVKKRGNKHKFQAAYNFQNATDPTHPRIELNQHCGTLHGPAIVDWVAICKFILEPPRPVHDSSLIAASRILRQRVEQGFTVFDCLRSDGIGKMRYYTPRKEFQVPDLIYWPARTRPVLKYDPEPGPARSYRSLDDVEAEAQKWAKFTKGVKGTSNSTYSFGVELEMFLPTSEHPTKDLKPSFYAYQYIDDPPNQLFFDIGEKLRLAQEEGSVKGASREDSQPWTPTFPETEPTSTIEVSSSDTSMMDVGSVPVSSLLDSDPMDVDASSEEDTTPENDPHPNDPREIARGRCFSRRAHQLAGIVSSFGHPAYFICNHSNGTGRPWKRELAKHGLFHVGDLKLNYHAWSLEQDGSLGESLNWGGYWGLTGLELISPVCQDVPEDWEMILDVVGGFATKVRVMQGANCGLHVHVGKGQQILPIHLLRKMFCLMCCVENIVFSLCHPLRRHMAYSTALMASADEIRRYSKNRAPHPDLKKYFPDEVKEDPLLWVVLKEMWIVRDLGQLKNYCRKVSLSVSTCQALNAKGQPSELHEEDVYVKGTVEFRHLEGTMSPDLVLRWGQLAVALFQFADLAKPNDWQKLISTALKCKDSSNYNLDLLDDFLQQLGLGEDFPFWEHRARYSSNIEIPGESNPVLAPDNTGQPPLNTKFERAVSDEGMEAIRKNICQRDRTPPYLAQTEEEIS